MGSALSLALLCSAVARADPQADALVVTAKDLAAKGRWAEACVRFEAAQRQAPALETYCISAHSIQTFNETSCEQATARLTGQELKDCVGKAQAKLDVAGGNNSGCLPLLQ